MTDGTGEANAPTPEVKIVREVIVQEMRVPASWPRKLLSAAVVIILAVYVVFVLGMLVAMGLDRVRSDSMPIINLDIQDKADLALAQADRILSLLETVLGLVGVILPLALGVIVYIFQQNRTVIENLTNKAEDARRDAASSKARVEELNAETRGLDNKVREAVGKIDGAIEQDKLRELELRALQSSVQGDFVTLQSSLQTELGTLQRSVGEQKLDVEQALIEAQGATQVALLFRELMGVRRLGVMIYADTPSESIMSVYKLKTLFFRDSSQSQDQDRDMLRVEAIRTFGKVAKAAAMTPDLRAEFLQAIGEIAADPQEALVVRIEAMQVLQHENGAEPSGSKLPGVSRHPNATQDDPKTNL